jgi:hypothetical protein
VVVAVAGLLAIGSACAGADPAGLQVRGYPADIVFASRPQPTASLLGAIPPDLTSAQALADVELPAIRPASEPNGAAPRPPSTPLASRSVCRPAQPGSTALEAALTVPANARPEQGTYRWRKAGTFSLAVAPDQKLPVGGFETRKVRNVVERGNGVFTFEMVQPDAEGRFLRVTTWQVKPEPVAERASALSLSVAAGDPERGLALKAVDTLDADGTPVADGPRFHPTTALLVLPLPVVPGEQFQSVAVDPLTGETAIFEAQVGARDRVGACGEFVEGWQVAGTLTSSYDGNPYSYGLWAAPQFGALPILEHVARTSTLGSSDITFSLGQIHPQPEEGG